MMGMIIAFLRSLGNNEKAAEKRGEIPARY